MYFIVIRQEASSGCLEATLTNKSPEPIEGWPITEVIEIVSHSYAVNKLINLCSDFKRYNISVDPQHIPRTKRAPI